MSFWTAPTLYSLTGGFAGSAVTLAGAVVITRMSLANDRRERDRERADSRLNDEKTLKRTAAASLSTVNRALLQEAQWFPFARGRTMTALVEFVLTVGADCRREHPAVADWLSAECEALLQDVASAERSLWLPWVGRKRTQCGVDRMSKMMDAMYRWATSNDEWFATQNKARAARSIEGPSAGD